MSGAGLSTPSQLVESLAFYDDTPPSKTCGCVRAE